MVKPHEEEVWLVMSDRRCLLNVGLPIAAMTKTNPVFPNDGRSTGPESQPGSRGSVMEDLLPSLAGAYDDPAALCKCVPLSQDGAGAIRVPSLVEDTTSDDEDDEDMSRDLSKALDMSSSSCSSPRTRSRRHRSSVSTISTILHQERSGKEDTTKSLSGPADQERPSLLAKISTVFFRRNNTPKKDHSCVAGPTSRPHSQTLAATSVAAQSLRHQKELEDAKYARVIENLRSIGWCSRREIKSVEYKRSLINAQWDEKISLLSHAQCYK